MIERDYIMRMIQMLTQMLVEILFYKRKKDFPKAMNEIHKTARQLLGVDYAMLLRLSDHQLIELFRGDEELAIYKLYSLGVLFQEGAEIGELAEDGAVHTDERLKALSLLIEAGIVHGKTLSFEHSKRIDSLLLAPSDDEMPIHVQKKIFQYHTLCGLYDKAEDMLFNIIKKDAAFIADGITFYGSLLKQSDDQLMRGNMLRNEVEAGLAELLQKNQV